MRVLHVHSGNLYGGVETFLVALAREAHLAPQMASAYAVCFEGRFSRELMAHDAAPHVLGGVRLSRPDTIWRARRSLAEYLRQESFDLVACHQAWPYVIFGPTARRAGLPLVFWVHTVAEGRHWLDRLARSVPPDLALCNSRFTASYLSGWFPQAHVEWVYYPLTMPPAPDLNSGQREDFRQVLDTSPDEVVIVQVGRLESLKGHRVALEALSLLREVPGWKYWVIGGPQRSSDERYFAELKEAGRHFAIDDRVRFLGERTDVAAVLSAADIYCQPNTRPEAFGISLVEALAAGLPVVTSALGGACEIIDETCGFLIPPHDALALAAALRRLIADRALRLSLGQRAQARPVALCEPARQMRQIEQVLGSVVQGVGRPS